MHRKNRIWSGWILFLLLSLSIIFIYWHVFGETIGGDRERYLYRGDLFLEAVFAKGSVFDLRFDYFDILFLIPNVFIALGYRIFGDGFHTISIIFNGIFYLSSMGCIACFVRIRFFDNVVIGPIFIVLSLTAFLGLPGELVKYIFNSFSSDVITLFIFTVSLLSIVQALISRKGSFWWFALLLVLLSTLSRPPGVVLLALWVIAFASSYLSVRASSRIILITGVVCCVASLILWPWVIYELAQSGKDVGYGFGLVVERFQKGIVITGRESPRIEVMDSYFHYVELMILRFFYYFVPFRVGYSMSHIVMNTFVVTVIILGLGSCFFWFKKQSHELLAVCSTLVISIVFFGIFHAATQVEDWRYYLTVWPSIWILVITGISALEKKVPARINDPKI